VRRAASSLAAGAEARRFALASRRAGVAHPRWPRFVGVLGRSMILECPECRTRYLVPDSALGMEGRTVRCANCRHSWFQEPTPVDLPPEPVASPVSDPEPAPEPSPPEPLPTPPAEPPVYADPSYSDPMQPEPTFAEPNYAAYAVEEQAQDYDAFAHQAPFKPRRNPARFWTLLAVLAGLLMLVGAAAILWVGAPGLAQQLGLSIGPAETPLRLRDNPIERRELENGSELFAVSGQVINPSSERQRVPDIRAELRDAQGRLVYSWTITPERRTLAPGSTLDFNSAKLDVPSNSKQLELTFAGDGGA
jgi:predicted Zn finger-like uncharacterized protein